MNPSICCSILLARSYTVGAPSSSFGTVLRRPFRTSGIARLGFELRDFFSEFILFLENVITDNEDIILDEGNILF